MHRGADDGLLEKADYINKSAVDGNLLLGQMKDFYLHVSDFQNVLCRLNYVNF